MRADEVLGGVWSIWSFIKHEVVKWYWMRRDHHHTGWMVLCSLQPVYAKSTWSGSRKVTSIYGSKVETFANDSITFGKIYHPISWQSYESTGWMVPCSLQPVYVKKCVKHEGENWQISNSCNLRPKWLYKLCGRAIWRQPIDMKYEVG